MLRRLTVFSLLCAASAAGAASAAEPPLSPAALLAATAGQWQGELQYRDYQSNQWQGLPVTVAITSQPDGVTTVRTAAYDDGPKTGTVWITTLITVDPAAGQVAYATARKGRALESGMAALAPSPAARDATRDATHWSLVQTERRRDGNGMAQVRETTVRDGDSMITLKEVDPVGDGKTQWLPRNRTILKLVRP